MERYIYPSDYTLVLYEQVQGRINTPVRFTIKKLIGEGSSCVAYEGISDSGLPVILKQLAPESFRLRNTTAEEAEKKFIEVHRKHLEIINTPSLSNITSSLNGIYRDGERRLWTSVKGTFSHSYSSIITENTLYENLKLIRLLTDGVSAFHTAGFLLLDITPNNVLFVKEPGVTAVNFFDLDSLVSVSELDAIRQSNGKSVSLVASSAFGAPELTGDSRFFDLNKVNAGCDIYSIGAVLYYAVFGRTPYEELFFGSCSIPGMEYDFDDALPALKPELNDPLKKALNGIFQKTLCLEQTGRYADCGSLLDALDQCIALFREIKPEISFSAPYCPEGFIGREEERRMIIQAIESHTSPFFVSGTAGMGKTTLVNSVAAHLSGQKRFCFVDYSGSIRATLLTVPIEHIKPEQSSDEEIHWKLTVSCLEQLSENDVLVIDNYNPDADRDATVNDPDYPLLCDLRLQCIILTRSGLNSLPGNGLEIGALSKAQQTELLWQYLPQENGGSIEKLVTAVNGHTLSLVLAAKTIASSGGIITVEKTLKALRNKKRNQKIRNRKKYPDENIEKTEKLFSLIAVQENNREVFPIVCLFPQTGIASELLCSLLSSAQWNRVRRLADCGWIIYDTAHEMWSIHPLLREVFLQNRHSWPTVTNTAAFMTNLRKIENEGVQSHRIASQIDAVFANYSRYARPQKPGILPAAVCVILLFAACAGFYFMRPETDLFNSATLSLHIEQDIEDPDVFAHDLPILKERLELLGVKGRNMTAGNTSLDVSVPLHKLVNRYGDPDSAIKNGVTINGAIKLKFHRGLTAYEVEPDPENIESVQFWEADYGVLNLKVRLKSGTIRRLIGEEQYDRISFSDGDSVFESINVQIGENEDELVMEVQDTSFTEDVMKAIVHAYTHEPLEGTYVFSRSVDPEILWTAPNGEEAEDWPHQCEAADITGDSAVFSYVSTSGGESVSGKDAYYIVRDVKKRMELLGCPYAIGSGLIDDKAIYVKVGTENLSLEALRLVEPFLYSTEVSSYNNTEPYTISCLDAACAEVTRSERTGGAALKISFADNWGGTDNFDTFLKHAEYAGTENVFLSVGDAKNLLSAELNSAADGQILFDGLWFLNEPVITEEFEPLLNLIAYTVNKEGYISQMGHICIMGEVTFSPEDAAFEYRRFTCDDERIKETVKKYPEVTGYFSDENHTGIDLYCDLPHGEDFIEKEFEIAEQIIPELDLLNSTYDHVYFNFGTGHGACRLCIQCYSNAMWYFPEEKELYDPEKEQAVFTCTGVCFGEDFDVYSDEFRKRFAESGLRKKATGSSIYDKASGRYYAMDADGTLADEGYIFPY